MLKPEQIDSDPRSGQPFHALTSHAATRMMNSGRISGGEPALA